MTTKKTIKETPAYTPTKAEQKALSGKMHDAYNAFKSSFKTFKESGKKLFEQTVKAWCETYHLPDIEDMDDSQQLAVLKAVKKEWRTEVCDNMEIVATPTFNNYLSTWCEELGYAKANTKPIKTGGAKGKGKNQGKKDNEGDINLSEISEAVSFDLSTDDDIALEELTDALRALAKKRYNVVLGAVQQTYNMIKKEHAA